MMVILGIYFSSLYFGLWQKDISAGVFCCVLLLTIWWAFAEERQ